MRHFQITARNDFHGSKPLYVNPYKKRGGKNRIIFWIILLSAVALAWVAMMIFLPYFRVTKITYYGLDIIKKSEFDNMLNTNFFKRRFGFIPGNNYFMVNTDKVSRAARDTYSLESITVKKIFPSGLLIDLKEKTSAIIYDNGQKYFLLDKNGEAVKYLSDVLPVENTFAYLPTASSTPTSTLYGKAASSTGQIVHRPDFRRIKNNFGQYPLLYDESRREVVERQKDIVPSNIIEAAISWQEAIKKEGIGEIRYFVLQNPLGGFIAETDKGWRIFIQPSNDLQVQLINLKTVLKSFHPKEYIDLRFDERVYWK